MISLVLPWLPPDIAITWLWLGYHYHPSGSTLAKFLGSNNTGNGILGNSKMVMVSLVTAHHKMEMVYNTETHISSLLTFLHNTLLSK